MAYAVTLVIGALILFAIGQAFQKLLDKTKKPGISLTINDLGQLAKRRTNLHNIEKSSSSEAGISDKSSCTSLAQPTLNNLSSDEMTEFIRKQQQIIRYHPLGQEESLKSHDQLPARSTPNQGLTAVFGVNNAFTTYEQSVARDFKNAARLKLQKSINLRPSTSGDQEGDWSLLIQDVRSMLEAELGRPDEVINLAELIQFLTLKISLKYLYPEQAGLENREAVKYIAKTVNVLWIRSKAFRTNSDGTTLALRGWSDEHRLRDHLRTLTGANPDDSVNNPMNFILPAYETMWRAVFKGVLEVYFRGAPDKNKWKKLLFDFLDNPLRSEFKRGDNSRTLSAKDVVKEVLRIYPPTRHVYRQFPADPLGHFHKADIEACHRLPLLAQNNPEWFRPDRWLEIKLRYEKERDKKAEEGKELSLHQFEEDLGFMPFALLCPAGKGFTQGFGFKMVALLVGSICRAFDQLNRQATWQLEPESPSDVLPPLGHALKSSREDYLSLVYRKTFEHSKQPDITKENDDNDDNSNGDDEDGDDDGDANTIDDNVSKK